MAKFACYSAFLIFVITLGAGGTVAARSSNEPVIAQISRALENGNNFFDLGNDLYAENVAYFHSYDVKDSTMGPATRDTIRAADKLLRRELIKDFKETMVRLVTDGKTIVATRHQTGTFNDGSKLDITTLVQVVVDNGKIVRIETWTDKGRNEKFADAFHEAIKRVTAQ